MLLYTQGRITNMELCDKIKTRRLSLGLTMDDVAKEVGVSKPTVQRWESGVIANMRRDKIAKLAKALHTTPAYLMGWTEEVEQKSEIPEGFSPPPEMVLKPLVGKIACGTPILAEQNIEDYINVPKDVKCDFLLTCDGDSMIEAGIRSGDVVYLIKQPDIDYNGQIAAVRIDGEATLKKVFKYQDKVILQPANANYEPLVYIKEEINKLVIEGIATGFIHKFVN